MVFRSQERYNALRLVVLAIFMLLIGRVFYLQMVDDSFESMSNNNVLRSEIIYPMRGEVYDRNGEYLVQVRGCYDMMVVYRDMDPAGFDTLSMCAILDITPDRLDRALRNARMRSRTPYLVANFVPIESKMLFDEMGGVKGFHPVYRTVRQYPRSVGGNLLGHVGEISSSQLAQNSYYSSGDYIGIGGIESAYEEVLRGEKGIMMQMVDNHGVVKDSYLDGLYDTPAKHGSTLVSTIDVRLQRFGEELLQGKVGSIVAIEPATGEILMMVSSPSFDPDDLVGRQRGNNYMDLLSDPRRPLYNRAVTSRYPPGSIFKLLQGLIGLQEGVITPYSRFSCVDGYYYGSNLLKCHKHRASTDLEYAVATSCNTYFCQMFNRVLSNKRFEGINEAYDTWRDYVLSFGFGRKLGSDFLSEGQGYVPEASYYDRIYRGSWSANTVISLSIGQGELGCTPLQMANLGAIIANRGYYYVPHIIRSVDGVSMADSLGYERQYAMVDERHYESVIEGMWACVNDPDQGSALLASLKGYDVCGKTGTAQNPHGEDHSTFLSFAPRNNPQIAVSVYVENGTWGATIAMPIATLVEEMYLTGEVKRDWLVDYVKNKKIEYPNYESK
ncbi:MAG: penicillin-binding transpeptidase domain-containing protein [Rikenellaceae bacterium]